MTRVYVSTVLRQTVRERAGGRCEYCLYPEEMSFLAFEVEHIVAEKHRGTTTADNLALACPYCNRFKGTDLGSLDPETGQLTPFFNPRAQRWAEHFRLDGARNKFRYSRVKPATGVGLGPPLSLSHAPSPSWGKGP